MSIDASTIEAAKTNGSTGPVTPQGKSRSSRNSLKHGLTAQDLFVPEDEFDEFIEFKAALLESTKPGNALQMVAFNQLLHAAWTLERIQRMEAEYLARGLDAIEDKETRRNLELLLRYQARHERAYYRARKEIEDLQTAEVARFTLPEDVQQVTPPVANPMKINSTKRTADKAWPVEEMITLTRTDGETAPARQPKAA